MLFQMFYSSGKCQIMHWRQGHKNTCQQWHGCGTSSSGVLTTEASEPYMPFLSNLSSPLPGGDIHLRDMNFDTSSEPSFPMTDSYNLDTDPFPVDRSTMNKLNHSLHTSENGAIGIPFGNNNHNADEETRSSEILSGNKVVFGKLLQFTSYSAPYMFVLNNSSLPYDCRCQVQKRRVVIVMQLILSKVPHNNLVLLLLKQEKGQNQASQFINLIWVSI
jgi:ubiquitin carboxyl-terminal hydrolase 36/42